MGFEYDDIEYVAVWRVAAGARHRWAPVASAARSQSQSVCRMPCSGMRTQAGRLLSS